MRWLAAGHKKDQNGKTHIMLYLSCIDGIYRIHGECSSANMHRKLKYGEYYPGRLESDIKSKGYKLCDFEYIERRFPNVITDIEIQLAISKLRNE